MGEKETRDEGERGKDGWTEGEKREERWKEEEGERGGDLYQYAGLISTINHCINTKRPSAHTCTM